MEFKDLLLEKKENVAILTLNRPDRLNAVNEHISKCFPLALQEAQEDDEVRALIITGAGRGFCAGEDVSIQSSRLAGQQDAPSRKAILHLTGALILAFEKMDKPVIAAVNGIAAGVGLTLALACDIRMASTDARFAAIWVKRGLIPDGGATYLLPLFLGLDKALELSFTGEILDAREAERVGLVSKIVPHEELMARAKDLAHRLAKMPPISIALTKAGMWQEIRSRLRNQLYFENYAQNICRKTQDHKEGVRAFMEKREPLFKGW